MLSRCWPAFAGLVLLLSFPASASQYKYIWAKIGYARVLVAKNEAPVAVADAFTVTEDIPQVLDVLANDSDEVMSTLSVAIGQTASHGTLTETATGRFNYHPADNFHGTDSFTYTLTDEKGKVSAQATVTITVSSVNDIPTLTATAPQLDQRFNQADTITAQATAADIDGSIALVRFRINGGPWKQDTQSPYAATFSFAGDGLSAGDNTIEFQSQDNEGAYSAITSRGIGINALPTVTVSSPTLYLSDQAVTVSASAADTDGLISRVEASRDNVNWSTDDSAPYSIPFGVLAQGSHHIRVRSVDNSGEYSATAHHHISINGLPTVSVLTPQVNTVLHSGVAVTASAAASDDTAVTQVAFRLNGGAWHGYTTAPYSHDFGVQGSGEYTIDYRARDNQGEYSAVVSRSVRVNTPPMVSPTGPADALLSNVPVVATASVTDADINDSVSVVEFRLNGGPWQTDSIAPYSYNFDVQAGGDYSIDYRARDSQGEYSAVETRSVRVNTPPVVSPTGPADALLSNVPVVATASVTDADSNDSVSVVEFRLNGGPWQTDSIAPYSYNFDVQAGGDYNIDYRARDSQGEYSAVESRSVRVNTLPVVSPTGPADALFSNVPVVATASATDADSNDSVSAVEFRLNGGPWHGYTTAPYSHDFGVLAGDEYRIDYRARDNQGEYSAVETRLVTVNTPPEVSVSAPDASTTLPSTAPLVASASATDANGTVTDIAFRLDNGPWWSHTTAPYRHDFGVQAGGDYRIDYRATDNHGESSAIVSQTVSVNTPPVISGTPAASVTAGQPYHFAPTGTDADDDSLTFSLSGHPTWLSIHPATGVVSGTPSESHVATVTGIVISVSDGTESASLPAFTLQVMSGNTAPVISGTPPTVVGVSLSYQFTPTATDTEGDALTFSVSGNPGWLSIHPVSGLLSGTPTATDVGTTSAITVSVTDGQAVSSLAPFSIVVGGENSPPVITGSLKTSVVVGQQYRAAFTVSDADEDTLTFSISGNPAWLTIHPATGLLTGPPSEQDIGDTGVMVISVSDGLQTTLSDGFTVTVNSPLQRRIIYIHTDALGSPAAESDENGEVN